MIGRARLGSAVASCIVATVASFCYAQPGRSETPALTQSDRESQELFPLVLAKEPKPQRCQYDLAWSREELPDYVAIPEFKLSVQAGLMPPFSGVDVRVLLDPDRRLDGSTFCDAEALKTYTNERVAAFDEDTRQHLQIDRTLFDYPIFDKSWTEAIVIVTHETMERVRHDGKIMRFPQQAGAEAEVYRKTDGHWRFVRSIMLWIT